MYNIASKSEVCAHIPIDSFHCRQHQAVSGLNKGRSELNSIHYGALHFGIPTGMPTIRNRLIIRCPASIMGDQKTTPAHVCVVGNNCYQPLSAR